MNACKVFVCCEFTWNNKGDAALLMATAQALRSGNPNVELSFSSFTPELDAIRFGERVVRMPIDPAGRPSKWVHRLGWFSPFFLKGLLNLVLIIFSAWLSFRNFLPEKFAYRLLGRFGYIAREIVNSDLVVAQGGGYLQAMGWRDDYWLFHWLTLKMAKAAGKPVAIYAQSVGPFAGRHRKWAIEMLREIDVIAAREDYSLDRLKEYGVPESKLFLVPDAAFGLVDDGRGVEELDSFASSLTQYPLPWIGVSAREHSFPGKDDPAASMEKYLVELARTADRMIELSGGTVFFVPQCILNGGRDVEVSREVVKRMEHHASARVVDEDLSPLALQVLYSRLEMLVGTRMHANILTMCVGTPVVAIAYERKTNGIMEMLGQSENVINIEDVEDRLLPLVERVYASRKEIRKKLDAAIPKIRQRAYETPKLIFDKLYFSAS